MSEILSAIRLKDKLTIAGVMAAVAVILATVVGLLTYFTADRHTHVYDYTLKMEEDGSFSLVGLCTVENCEKPYYNEANIEGVKVISAVSPTCIKEGNRVYTYVHEGVTVKYTEVLPIAEHTYVYDLVPNPGNDNVHINGKCEVEGCTDPYVFIYNVQDLTLVETIPATCFSPRKDVYAYVSGGETHTFTTLVGDVTSHTLNGMLADTFQNKDKTYTYGTPGIKLIGTTVLGCGETAEGYYQCEICKSAVGVYVSQPDHVFVYSESDLVQPTFDASGLATLNCSNDGCSECLEIEVPKVVKDVNTRQKSPATELHREVITYTHTFLEYGFTVTFDMEVGEILQHDYKYSLDPNKNDPSKMDLICRCSQPECQTPEVRVEKVETTFVNTSTCTQLGYAIWTHVLASGEEVILKVRSMAYGKHDYAYNNSAVINPSESKEGSVELYCTNPKCTHTETVTLPKMVIGENAFVHSETDAYIIYKYEYATEHSVNVVAYIFVYK